MDSNQVKPPMVLKWADESAGQPISRDLAARTIRSNRRAPKALRISVQRKYGETYIASDFLGVGCVIFKASSIKAVGAQR